MANNTFVTCIDNAQLHTLEKTWMEAFISFVAIVFQTAFLDHLAADNAFLSFPFTANALTALFIIFCVPWKFI